MSFSLRRLVALVVAPLLALGILVVSPAPAEAHSQTSAQTLALCELLEQGTWGPEDNGRLVWAWRYLHYGSTHVTQCEQRVESNGAKTCYMYVWGDPHVYIYPVNDPEPTPCW